jgi:hypothetical protein
MDTETVQTLAQRMVDAFESKTRATGETFYSLREGTDREWMSDVVHAAHGEMFPDDFKYATVLAVCEALADGTDLAGDDFHEWCDSQVDIYDRERADWLASAPGTRAAYVDEARFEFGGGETPLLDQLGRGQYMEIAEIAQSVVDSLTDLVAFRLPA